MRYRTFLIFNLIGGTVWASGVTILGYFLGQVSFVRDHIELILLAIVVVSVVPLVIEYLRARSRNRVDVRPY
jgi:membrane-associated protein